MVTPSFVISGEPNFLSSTTLRPFGPEGDFHRVRQRIDTGFQCATRVLAVLNLLCHNIPSNYLKSIPQKRKETIQIRIPFNPNTPSELRRYPLQFASG